MGSLSLSHELQRKGRGVMALVVGVVEGMEGGERGESQMGVRKEGKTVGVGVENEGTEGKTVRL